VGLLVTVRISSRGGSSSSVHHGAPLKGKIDGVLAFSSSTSNPKAPTGTVSVRVAVAAASPFPIGSIMPQLQSSPALSRSIVIMDLTTVDCGARSETHVSSSESR
jgi:hypothetical protein